MDERTIYIFPEVLGDCPLLTVLMHGKLIFSIEIIYVTDYFCLCMLLGWVEIEVHPMKNQKVIIQFNNLISKAMELFGKKIFEWDETTEINLTEV